MNRLARVVDFKPSYKIGSESNVSLSRMVNRANDVNVLHTERINSRHNLMPKLRRARFASLLLQSLKMIAFYSSRCQPCEAPQLRERSVAERAVFEIALSKLINTLSRSTSVF